MPWDALTATGPLASPRWASGAILEGLYRCGVAMRYIVSVCGTSVLSSSLSDGEERARLREMANVPRDDELSPSQAQLLDRVEGQARTRLKGAAPAEAARLSAEVNGIWRLLDRRIGDGRGDFHALICTDTAAGRRSAEVVLEWLEGRGLTGRVHPIPELRTREASEFRRGVCNLADWCENNLPPDAPHDPRQHVVFNLTGGFKAVVGAMHTLAILYADEIIYVFEEGGVDLLRIPRLPLTLDAPGLVRDHAGVLRRVVFGRTIPWSDRGAVPEVLLYEVGGEAELSPWGRVVWNRGKGALYASDLDPWNQRIRYTSGLRDDIRRLDPPRQRDARERLDMLGAWAQDRSRASSLDALRVRAITGQHGASTHECNAWSDGDAQRIFFHLEEGPDGDVVVVDRLTKGLH